MNAYFESRFSESMEVFEEIARSCKGPDEERAGILCNIAATAFALELYRKCLKAVSEAIQLHPYCIRAYWLQAKAYLKLGKSDLAIKCCQQGLSLRQPHLDVIVMSELSDLLSSCNKGPNAQVGLKGLAEKAEATEERDANKGSQLQSLLCSLLQDSNTCSSVSITARTLQSARSNLSHASGEDVVDDLIAFGYLMVNIGNLQQACSIFDELVSYRKDLTAAYLGLGSAHAISGNFQLATDNFTLAIKCDPTAYDAWKRRGQTRAAMGCTMDALKDLSRSLELSSDPDIFYQRGLVYHQMKHFSRAVFDLRKAVEGGLSAASVWNYIGICEGQLGNVTKSLKAHEKAIALDPKFKEALLNLAQMLKESGRAAEAEKAFNKALAVATAASSSASASASDPVSLQWHQGYFYRAIFLQGIGRPREALEDLLLAIDAISSGVLVPRTTQEDKGEGQGGRQVEGGGGGVLVQYYAAAANCAQAIGRFDEAIQFFTKALEIEPDSYYWFQREVAAYYRSKADGPIAAFNPDNEIDPIVKVGWCKHASPSEVTTGISRTVYPCSIRTNVPTTIGTSADTIGTIEIENKKIKRLVDTKPLTNWVQLRCPGFLANARHHKMFGLALLLLLLMLLTMLKLPYCRALLLTLPAAVQMAKALHSHVISKTNNNNDSSGDDSPVTVETSSDTKILSILSSKALLSSSSSKTVLSTSLHTTTSFGWRDFFDIVVRWRQVSEMGDPVWWIDRLPQEAFSEGFGLQTPIVSGELKTIRYYCYFPRAFEITKRLIKQKLYNVQGEPVVLETASQRAKVDSAETLDDLLAAVGHAFYVIVPFPSIYSSGEVYEGTRLTLLDVSPAGFEFTIRTPGTPIRWKQFSMELDHAFAQLEQLLIPLVVSKRRKQHRCQLSDEIVVGEVSHDTLGERKGRPREQEKQEEVLYRALEIFYIFVNFAPLTRGTALCGYAAVQAILLCVGVMIPEQLPENKQLDWEAIFASDCEEFVHTVTPWLRISDSPLLDLDLDFLEDSFYDMFPTLRAMIAALDERPA